MMKKQELARDFLFEWNQLTGIGYGVKLAIIVRNYERWDYGRSQ